MEYNIRKTFLGGEFVENKEKKLKLIFNFLINNEGFHMDQYETYEGELKWIGLRNVQNGVLAMVVTDDVNAYYDEQSARAYLNSKGINYRLDIIILSQNGNTNIENISLSKIIIDSNNDSIIYSSPELLPLANVLTEIINPRKRSREIRKGFIVTISLIAINIIVYLISAMLSGSMVDIDSMTLLKMGAKYNPLISRGEVWRLFTAAFLHGGILHLACNMYILYAVGTQVEKIYGKLRYIIIYILSALGSSILSYLFAPKSLSVGASGAIFGVLGALLVFVIKEKDKLSKGTLGNILAVIALNLYIGFTTPNIDNYGHIGGLIVGIIISVILGF